MLTEVSVGRRRSSHGEPFPTVGDVNDRSEPEADRQRFIGTAAAGEQLKLTLVQKRRPGALFAYQIEGRPKPKRLFQTAVKLSGDSVCQINGKCVTVMDYVNRHRDIPIDRIEDLRYQLVEVAGVIVPEDVPESGW